MWQKWQSQINHWQIRMELGLKSWSLTTNSYVHTILYNVNAFSVIVVLNGRWSVTLKDNENQLWQLQRSFLSSAAQAKWADVGADVVAEDVEETSHLHKHKRNVCVHILDCVACPRRERPSWRSRHQFTRAGKYSRGKFQFFKWKTGNPLQFTLEFLSTGDWVKFLRVPRNSVRQTTDWKPAL